MEVKQRRDRVGDLTICATVAGQHGPPLLLIHGLAGSARWWAKSIQPLAEHFRVYAIDLVGFGGSRNRRFRFGLAEAACHVARWLDHLGIDRASVVGHSMGGYIAIELAADFGSRVDRLVLVDAAVLPLDQSRVRATLSLARSLLYIPPAFLPVLIWDACRAGPVTIWNAANQLLAADIRPKLALVDTPTLVVWGANDTLLPPRLCQQLVDALSNASLALIESAGHNPMLDRPETFNRMLLDFLQPD